jgi:CheY-like chemotaxis protein
VEQALALQPDVIMIDLVAREGDGCSLVRELKANASTKSIPVIACQPAGDQMRVAAETAGVDAHVTKPCLAEYLVSLARRQLR